MIDRRQLLGASALALGASALSHAAAPREPELRSRFAFEANVSVAAPLVVGEGAVGLRRIVPITGGTVKGPRLNGRVVPGGADWQYVRPDGVIAIEAKYTLEADDGTLIMVTNKGMRHGPQAVLDRIARGEPVDPSEYYFRTSAEFEVAVDSKHAWLNRAVFIGVAERKVQAAVVKFFEVL
jgi:hypothetical protein